MEVFLKMRIFFFFCRGRRNGGSFGFPFTMAQWKELQRQAMIYKYMVASLPVPPYLLCSSDQDPAAAASHSSCNQSKTLSFSS